MTINLLDVINYRYQNKEPPILNDGKWHDIVVIKKNGLRHTWIDNVEVKGRWLL